MKKESFRKLWVAAGLLVAFVLWTVALCFIDRQPIGPQGSVVGFATIDRFFHRLTGVHMSLYLLTDWLGLVPLGVVAGLAALGLAQWIRRKQLWKVDRSLLVLGGYYLVVFAVYAFFEVVAINHRPVLIGGVLEASYPSSTTMLVMCVMPTAVMQLHERVKSPAVKRWGGRVIVGYSVFMVVTRMISGVHWLTDIIGGALFSIGMVMLYGAFVGMGREDG